MALKILFLAANPDDTGRLQLGREHREITEKIKSSPRRNALVLIPEFAVRPSDLQQLLLEHQPDILHFSGHGNSSGEILLQDELNNSRPVPPDALKSLLRVSRDNIRLVFLNACHSSKQGMALREVVDFAVGMKEPISDDAAITFAGAFYRALAYSLPVRQAFDHGVTALLLERIPEENVPKLHVRPGADANDILVHRPRPSAPRPVAAKRPQGAAGPMLEVRLTLNLPGDAYSERVRDYLTHAVAQFLDISFGEVVFVREEYGSVTVVLRLQRDLAQKLEAAYYNGDRTLAKALFPLSLVEPSQSPIQRILAAGADTWVPGMWGHFITVLCFARLVHHTFYVVHVMHTASLVDDVSELVELLASGSVPVAKQLQFQREWQNYDRQYHDLRDEELELLSPDYTDVQQALTALQTHDNAHIARQIHICDDFFRAILTNLREYDRRQKDADQMAADASKLLAIFSQQQAATEFLGHVAQLAVIAPKLAADADALLKLLLKTVLER